ncbi:hypothetical protein VTO42DRAFT_4429 [Malbranchea cinnamomea]
MNSTDVKTRFLILSDTHGRELPLGSLSRTSADVVIHCGDLTEGSRLEEFQNTLMILQAIDAPLKLIIAGNHDFTLDVPVFKSKVAAAEKYFNEPLEPTLLEATFGRYGQARELFELFKNDGIILLDEGTHQFKLANGAQLTIYASPYTPSVDGSGFSYTADAGHEFRIEKGVDVVLTHGPPRGILDHSCTEEKVGCPDLFAAVARARPRLHCFGHVHCEWGAMLASWRQDNSSETLSHVNAIDNDRSVVIDRLPRTVAEKREKLASHPGTRKTSHCADSDHPLTPDEQTLFVNAAMQGTEDFPLHPPWLVDIELPRAP